MDKKWWKEAVFYQIYPKSFCDSNGDGVGDLNGIRQKLSYLKALGVNAIWICPFYDSPMEDNGYDISDYEAIYPEYGTMADCDALISEANAMGLKIIMDMVINHTSHRHPWFRQACSDKNSKYRDFYIFREDVSELPQLRSCFGGSTWTQIEDGSWYFHTFAAAQPDLNWENPELREELYGMINRWLDKGISGFRMDAITFIKKDFTINGLNPDGADGRTAVGSVFTNRPGIELFLRELRDRTYGKPQFVTVAEAPGVPKEDLTAYIGENGFFSMVFDFSYTDIDVIPGRPWVEKNHWTTTQFKDALFANQYAVSATGWAANYLENHDQPRSINKYFPETDVKRYRERMAKSLGILFFFLRGTPFIYQGQELGMVNTCFSDISQLNDINSKGEYERCLGEGYTEEQAMAAINRRSRDHARLPMQWNSAAGKGFSTGSPWLGFHNVVPEVNAEEEMSRTDSVWQHYHDMIALRNHSELSDVLIYGQILETASGNADVICYKRYLGDKCVNIAVNMGAERIIMKMNRILLKSVSNDKDFLEPYDAAVWMD